ncbi:MAG: pilus assembly protein PilM [Niameybacter sp.]
MLRPHKHLSIHIGRDKIKVAYLSKQKDKVIIHKAFEVPLAEGAVREGIILDKLSLAQTMQEAFTQHGIKAKDTIFSVYHPRMITREVELPALNKAKLEKIIEISKQDYFPVDISQYLIGHRVMEVEGGKDNKHAKVLLVAIPDEAMNQYVELAKLLDLVIIGLDYQENSILNFLHLQSFLTMHMLIHIESEATTVTIMTGEEVAFVKTIPFGTATFVESLQSEYALTYEAAQQMLYEKVDLSNKNQELLELRRDMDYMLNSIATYIKYYNSKENTHPIKEIYLSGTGSAVKGIAQVVESTLDILTQQLPPLHGVVNKTKDHTDVLALGLEMVIGAAFANINLMPKKITEHLKTREKTRLGILILILISVSMSAVLIQPFRAIQQLKVEKQSLEAEVVAYEQILLLDQAYQQVLNENKMRQLWLEEANTPSDGLLEMLERLEAHIPSGITVQSFSSTTTNVSMNCMAQDRMTVAQFIAVLKAIPSIQEVYVGGVSETPGTNTEEMMIQFAVTCTYREVEQDEAQ